MHKYRTHTCNELTLNDAGKNVRLSGWIHNVRNLGGLLFIDLRDNYGITQIVIYPECDIFEEAAKLAKESVVCFDGTVQKREVESTNKDLKTREIEVNANKFEVLGKCNPLPINVFPEDLTSEELRLKYRYIDLRRSKMHSNILLRSKIVATIRKYMYELGFNEITTPILTSSSPEGARDYLVPSRLYPGNFYALPQSPQQFKQLLMVSGFDKYFQIAPCFRDEDSRADRSPGEFYQLDVEMSFVTQEDVFAAIEYVLANVFAVCAKEGKKVDGIPFTRIPYKEALLKYGTDKPDLRNPLVITDVTSIFKGSEFKAFSDLIEKGGVVRAISVPNISNRSRSFYDKVGEYAKSIGSKGMAYLVFASDGVKGPIFKFLAQNHLEALKTLCNAGNDAAVFFIGDQEKEACRIAGSLRQHLGHELDLVEKDVYRFCWITDFPMFEWNEEDQKVDFAHNPFSMPQGGLEALNTQDPLDVIAYQYDIVCNGIELSSGAIRNHEPEIMYKAFGIAGYPQEVVDDKFSGMINAFRFGAPPHGGLAPGIDRMCMLLADESNIREVIAFPFNQKAQDLMMNAPNQVSEKQLKELKIKVGEK